jgi:spore coat polysaccharide biosynthesis protein SpsF (cytidylyltransferase family)
MNLLDRITKELHNASAAANMTRMSLGFLHEHFIACDANGNPCSGAEPVHITDLVKKRAKLYIDTWVKAPIDRAQEDIRNNVDLFEDMERLGAIVDGGDLQAIMGRIDSANRANMKASDR